MDEMEENTKDKRQRERKEKRGGQKQGEAKLLDKLEKRDSHGSAEFFVVCLRYFALFLTTFYY